MHVKHMSYQISNCGVDNGFLTEEVGIFPASIHYRSGRHQLYRLLKQTKKQMIVKN